MIEIRMGVKFQNKDANLPTQDSNGNFIKYKEYKVEPLEGGDNVHRIVVENRGRK